MRFFDVSLRDGLQACKKAYSFSEKKNILKNIVWGYNPQHIEVGSIVSPKVLPMMKDSIELYKFAEYEFPKKNFYLLVPNQKNLEKGVQFGVRNFSFITSVSTKFQEKNIRKTLDQTKNELETMMNYLEKSDNYDNNNGIKKLYISCINECPIAGIINEKKIVNEIIYYTNNFNFNNICLSDTCGTLQYNQLTTIVNELLSKNISPELLSIHLHVDENSQDKINNIKKFLLNNNINLFDVSTLEKSGGCSVTIENGKTKRNLNYTDLLTQQN